MNIHRNTVGVTTSSPRIFAVSADDLITHSLPRPQQQQPGRWDVQHISIGANRRSVQLTIRMEGPKAYLAVNYHCKFAKSTEEPT